MREQIDLAADRVLRDCIALGAPPPEFLVRVGREPLERFDARYPGLVDGLLERLDPDGVIVHVSVPPELPSTTVRCTPDSTVETLAFALADEVQQLLVEGELRGAAWPPCPAHDGRHPLWPDLTGGRATWTCSTPPTFSRPIGTLPGER